MSGHVMSDRKFILILGAVIVAAVVGMFCFGCTGVQRGAVNVTLGYDDDGKPIDAHRLLSAGKEQHALTRDRIKRSDGATAKASKQAENAAAQAEELRKEHALSAANAQFRERMIGYGLGALGAWVTWITRRRKAAVKTEGTAS